MLTNWYKKRGKAADLIFSLCHPWGIRTKDWADKGRKKRQGSRRENIFQGGNKYGSTAQFTSNEL